MKVRGIEAMTLRELIEEVRLGGRFVMFHCCVGLLFATHERPSAVHFVRSDETAARRGFWHSLGTALLGWWAIPFGPSRTIACLRENIGGGRDVTASVLRTLARVEAEQIRPMPARTIPGPVTSHAA